MMRRLSMAIAVVLLAAVAGTYLSGLLTLALLFGIHGPAMPHLATFWEYRLAIAHPDFAPYAHGIGAAGLTGYGLPMVVAAVLVHRILRPRPRALHGNARFARLTEVLRAGLLTRGPFGIVIGRAHGRLLRLDGARHVLLAAPTRSGKTAGVAIPALLTYEGSAVALDIKGELHAVTSGWRARCGQRVFVWAPYADDRRGHRFNPLQCVATDPGVRASQIQSIAASLYPEDVDKDPFWVHQARNAFFGCASFLYERWDADIRALRQRGVPMSDWPDPNDSDGFPSLARVLRLCAGEGVALKEHLLALAGMPFVSIDTRASLVSVAGQADATRASIIGSMQEPLLQFLNPILAQATDACDFALANLRRQPTTIYVVVPPNKLAEARKLLNVFFSLVVGENTRRSPRDDPSLSVPCLLLMDEFTSMGRVDVLASSIAHIAGYGLRSLPIVQSQSQLDAVYGPELARTFRTNHGVTVAFTPREQEDAGEYSRMLGDTTVRVRHRSASRSRGQVRSTGRSVSWSESDERRPLMLPQEVKALGARREIVFVEGLAHPILARKIRYYRERYFRRRLLPAAQAPALPPTLPAAERPRHRASVPQETA